MAEKHYWREEPEAEGFLRAQLDKRLADCPGAQAFSDNLLTRTAVRLRDILDHFTFNDAGLTEPLSAAGWQETSPGIWQNPTGLFPAFIARDGVPTTYFRVEDMDNFAAVHRLDGTIEGAAHGPARRMIAFQNTHSCFGAFERTGHIGFDVPKVSDDQIKLARMHRQALGARRRAFDTVEAGLEHTDRLVDAAVAAIGQHWACAIWLKAERDFWMQRCVAGRRQKIKQDQMGIGWSNIDHHTYDSSREHFRRTIQILEKLGYELREMLYAGELAGWGSQVLEQPALNSTIFADVDLAPEELTIDFAHEPLPPLKKHRRSGVLSVLHGESILEAGLNHVAGLYDWRTMHQLLSDEGIAFMAPFSNFKHLYQELTIGDWGAVDPKRVDALEAGGHIGADEADKLRQEGAIVTHLENIERNDGFKGFNREGIDGVLRKLDPRAYAGNKAAAS